MGAYACECAGVLCGWWFVVCEERVREYTCGRVVCDLVCALGEGRKGHVYACVGFSASF